MLRGPHHQAVSADQVLGHAEVVVDRQEHLAALLLQHGLERAGLVDEDAGAGLGIEFRGQDLAVPEEVLLGDLGVAALSGLARRAGLAADAADELGRRHALSVHPPSEGVVAVFQQRAVGELDLAQAIAAVPVVLGDALAAVGVGDDLRRAAVAAVVLVAGVAAADEDIAGSDDALVFDRPRAAAGSSTTSTSTRCPSATRAPAIQRRQPPDDRIRGVVRERLDQPALPRLQQAPGGVVLVDRRAPARVVDLRDAARAIVFVRPPHARRAPAADTPWHRAGLGRRDLPFDQAIRGVVPVLDGDARPGATAGLAPHGIAREVQHEAVVVQGLAARRRCRSGTWSARRSAAGAR